MHDYEKLKEKICDEIAEYEKKDRYSMSDIEILDKLVNTAKNIDKIMMYEEGGHSNRNSMRSYDGGSYRESMYDPWSYDDGSHRRGRDAMGRYTSRDDMSRGKDGMITKLNRMLDEAVEQSDKDAIRRCLSQIQNA